LAYGFYVEATGKREDDPKYPHWRNFRERLRADGELRRALSTAFIEHKLVVADYYHRHDTGGALGGQFRSENQKLQWSPAGAIRWEDCNFDELVERIVALDGDQWVDLHVYAHMDSSAAIAMSPKILEPMIDVLTALTPVYRAVIDSSDA
jgi:hypothetical protein